MNTLSIVKMSVDLVSNGDTHHTLPLKTDTRSTEVKAAERSRTRSSAGAREPTSAAKSKLRLGEVVRHSRFGRGRVLAHWADGTILVRFDDVANNQLIWPSFLDRVNGHQR